MVEPCCNIGDEVRRRTAVLVFMLAAVRNSIDGNYRSAEQCPLILSFPAEGRTQNTYDPQALNRYAFERNNPYRNNDPTGHVYWDQLALASLSLAGAISSIVLGSSIALGSTVTGPGAIVGVVVGGLIAAHGAGQTYDAVGDALAAIYEDDAYIAADKGGYMANLGYKIKGEKGAKEGRSLEFAIDLGLLVANPGELATMGGTLDGLNMALSTNDVTTESNGKASAFGKVTPVTAGLVPTSKSTTTFSGVSSQYGREARNVSPAERAANIATLEKAKAQGDAFEKLREGVYRKVTEKSVRIIYT